MADRPYNKSFGAQGESVASQFLIEKGFTILHKNFRTRFGEIDIIAKRNNTIHFVEVKTRSSLLKGKPYEAVRSWKILHLIKAGEIYLLQNKIKDCKLSLDTVSIVLDTGGNVLELLFFENITG